MCCSKKVKYVCLKLLSKIFIKIELIIFLLSFFLLSFLEIFIMKSISTSFNGRFQSYSSEELMQTVEITSLVNSGFWGFFYLHIQPPIFDILRFILVLPENLKNTEINDLILDYRIYFVHIIIYSFLNVIVFKFGVLIGLKKSTALIVTFVWALYPGNLFCATLLDSTYLSTFFMTLTFFFFYKSITQKSLKVFCVFLFFTLLMTLTRTVFQIHIIIPIILYAIYFTFFNKSVSNKRLSLQIVSIIIALLLLALPMKQLILFGTTSTTTFAGYHKVGVIWASYSESSLDDITVPSHVINNSEKFVSKLNSPESVVNNYRLEHLFPKIITNSPFESLYGITKSVWLNFKNASTPTSQYTSNLFVDRHPLLNVYNRIFSFPIYTLLVSLSVLYLLSRKKELGINPSVFYHFVSFYALPLSTILLANRYDWTESIRLKTIIEIPLFLIIGLFCQDFLKRNLAISHIRHVVVHYFKAKTSFRS